VPALPYERLCSLQVWDTLLLHKVLLLRRRRRRRQVLRGVRTFMILQGMSGRCAKMWNSSMPCMQRLLEEIIGPMLPSFQTCHHRLPTSHQQSLLRPGHLARTYPMPWSNLRAWCQTPGFWRHGPETSVVQPLAWPPGRMSMYQAVASVR